MADADWRAVSLQYVVNVWTNEKPLGLTSEKEGIICYTSMLLLQHKSVYLEMLVPVRILSQYTKRAVIHSFWNVCSMQG